MGILQISLIILIVISAMYLISFWAIPKKGDLEKLSAYENGFNPIGDARMKIDIIYWIIGLLYLIFDLELIFLIPFASIIYSINSFFAFSALMFFLIILALGFAYEYISNALNILPPKIQN